VHRSQFRSLAIATQRSYALDLRLLFSFLHRRDRDWAEASDDDLFDYEHWRRRHPENPSTIGGAKWAREIAAISLLYRWALSQRLVDINPADALASPRDVRSSRVRWLTPRALQVWKQVGILGYDAAGQPGDGFISSTSDRNAAFVDLLYASGLRVREGGSLLAVEIPRPFGGGVPGMSASYVASACAKGGRARQFWVTPRALRALEGYITTTRRAAVRRAQERGNYEQMPGIRRVIAFNRETGVVRYKFSDGSSGRINIDNLDPSARLQYFQDGPDGLEPMALWLDVQGRPVSYRVWSETVFPDANELCARRGISIMATPHMLRHSFALRMLVALEYALSSRSGMTVEERRREDMLLGNPFDLVRDLLGHSSTMTTRRHYLEPLAGLRIDHLLGDEDDDDLRRLITRIAERSPLIQDAPHVLESLAPTP